ncbi:TPA: hypothetical protein GDO54_018559 [Pyxicephalus adspersus]|uniref:Ig-like domain-containing protein n=1 Tax=Pyxicephalus adspersus TaxID=30357 RepID=A0AAV2ZNM0_PYXAD|nr:TPA: hypothetical protein GDO54_018559 [Pyxicephalus adspersus]
MFWSPLLLTVCWFYTCCLGQYVLNQPTEMTAKPEETVKLTCSGKNLTSKYYVSWYQQKSGSAPHLLIYKDKEKASGTPDRFSEDNANDVGTLTISGVLTDDEANYYCYVGSSKENLLTMLHTHKQAV